MSREESKKFCKLICWSLKGKDGEQRPPVCPECGEPAEVDLNMVGMPSYFHRRLPAPPPSIRRKRKKAA